MTITARRRARVRDVAFTLVTLATLVALARPGEAAAAWQGASVRDTTREGAFRAGENVRITTGVDSTTPFVEPHLAVDPRDPRRMVAAAMAVLPDRAGTEIRVFTSEDGGRTWTRRAFTSDARQSLGADPHLAWGADGVVHLVTLPGSLWRSADGGRTWSGPLPLPNDGPGSFDYPKIVADASAGPHAGRVYVWSMHELRVPNGQRAATPSLHRLDRGAASVRAPVRLLRDELSHQVGDPVVLTDGTLVAPFHELSSRGRLLATPRLWVTRSRDGGDTFEPATLVAEQFRADSPSMAADASAGATRDRVYLASTGIRADGSRAVFVVSSADRGVTWSAPVLVRDTLPRSGYLPHRPAIAVNRDGVVGVTWQDPRPALGTQCFQLSFSASRDGGRTWSAPVPVAGVGSCSDVPGNAVPLGDGRATSRRWGDGGDYHGLVALPDGGWWVVWADSRSGRYQVWGAGVESPQAHRSHRHNPIHSDSHAEPPE